MQHTKKSMYRTLNGCDSIYSINLCLKGFHQEIAVVFILSFGIIKINLFFSNLVDFIFEIFGDFK